MCWYAATQNQTNQPTSHFVCPSLPLSTWFSIPLSFSHLSRSITILDLSSIYTFLYPPFLLISLQSRRLSNFSLLLLLNTSLPHSLLSIYSILSLSFPFSHFISSTPISLPLPNQYFSYFSLISVFSPVIYSSKL